MISLQTNIGQWYFNSVLSADRGNTDYRHQHGILTPK